MADETSEDNVRKSIKKKLKKVYSDDVEKDVSVNNETDTSNNKKETSKDYTEFCKETEEKKPSIKRGPLASNITIVADIYNNNNASAMKHIEPTFLPKKEKFLYAKEQIQEFYKLEKEKWTKAFQDHVLTTDCSKTDMCKYMEYCAKLFYFKMLINKKLTAWPGDINVCISKFLNLFSGIRTMYEIENDFNFQLNLEYSANNVNEQFKPFNVEYSVADIIRKLDPLKYITELCDYTNCIYTLIDPFYKYDLIKRSKFAVFGFFKDQQEQVVNNINQTIEQLKL